MRKQVILVVWGSVGDEILYSLMWGLFHKPWNKDFPFLTNQDFLWKVSFRSLSLSQVSEIEKLPDAYRLTYLELLAWCGIENIQNTGSTGPGSWICSLAVLFFLCVGNDWTVYHIGDCLLVWCWNLDWRIFFSNGLEVQPPTRTTFTNLFALLLGISGAEQVVMNSYINCIYI